MDPEYPNLQLSRDYIRVAAQHVSTDRYQALLRCQRKIREADVDVPAYYREHGNLQDLVINGKPLAELTVRTLEMILEIGVDETEKIVEAARIESMRERDRFALYAKRPSKIGDTYSDDNPSWENAVRTWEG